MEDIIKTNPLVSHCTVIGEALPCTAALIELNFDTVKSHCLDVVLERGKLCARSTYVLEIAAHYSGLIFFFFFY